MKFRKKYTIFYFVMIIFLSLFSMSVASATTSFSFNVPEGQGGSANEFYHGRCVRAEVLLDTDGNNTGGADLEVNYDNSRIKILNSDCLTPATQIYTGSLYDNYVNNHVTNNKIVLGSYNNPGNSYNGKGVFAYFYFEVLDGSGNYNLDFEFTSGDTTDTNLAELGTGNDILDNAFDYTLSFADDDDTPYLTKLTPDNNDTDIEVISDIKFRINDLDAGVDINSLAVSLTGNDWGVTNYTNSSSEFAYSCHSTNANRIDYCDVTINPSKNLYYCEKYTPNITVSDLGNPIVHTLSNYSYSFDTEIDNNPVSIYNTNPQEDAKDVVLDSNIRFNLRDLVQSGNYPGTGVDISTLKVTVSSASMGTQVFDISSDELIATPLAVNDYSNVYDYQIDINPKNNFGQNELVSVNVYVKDYGCTSVNVLDYTYTFTSADTIAPECNLFSPEKNSTNIDTDDDITFRCTDTGVGIDIDSFSVVVDAKHYSSTGDNRFSFHGDPSEYYITINPDKDLDSDYALDVIINGGDFSGNKISQISYGLATSGQKDEDGCKKCEDSCEKTPECPICKTCNDSIVTKENIKETREIKKEKSIQKKEVYKKCEIFDKTDKKLLLSAVSPNSNFNLNSTNLTKINGIDVQIGNRKRKSFWDKLLDFIYRRKNNSLITISDDVIVFEGSALPNSKVSLLIESTPIVVTGLSDDKGKWKIEIQNILTSGLHKVSVVSVSKDEYILKTKEMVRFSVERNISLWCILVVVILVIVIYSQRRRIKKIKKMLKNSDKE